MESIWAGVRENVQSSGSLRTTEFERTPEPVHGSASQHFGAPERMGRCDVHVTAELSVGDRFDANLALALNLLADRLILDLLQLLASALALVVLGTLGEQLGGACASLG